MADITRLTRLLDGIVRAVDLQSDTDPLFIKNLKIGNSATSTYFLFDSSAITSGQNRTITVPDAAVDLGAIATNATNISNLVAAVGSATEGAINYSSNNYVVDGEDTVVSIGKLDTAIKNIADELSGFEWQPSVNDVTTTPPGSPSTGDRYLINGTGTGDWTGHDNKIAEWDGAAWVYTVVTTGTFVSADDEAGVLYLYGGSSWTTKTFEATTAGAGLSLSGNELSIQTSGVTNAMLAGSIADSKLNQITTADKVAGSAVQLAASSGLEDSTGLKISDSGVTNAMLAGSIADDKLALDYREEVVLTSNGDETALSSPVEHKHIKITAAISLTKTYNNCTIEVDESVSSAVIISGPMNQCIIKGTKIEWEPTDVNSVFYYNTVVADLFDIYWGSTAPTIDNCNFTVGSFQVFDGDTNAKTIRNSVINAGYIWTDYGDETTFGGKNPLGSGPDFELVFETCHIYAGGFGTGANSADAASFALKFSGASEVKVGTWEEYAQGDGSYNIFLQTGMLKISKLEFLDNASAEIVVDTDFSSSKGSFELGHITSQGAGNIITIDGVAYSDTGYYGVKYYEGSPVGGDYYGDALTVNGSTGEVEVLVDGTTITVNGSNQLQVKDAGITEAKLGSDVDAQTFAATHTASNYTPSQVGSEGSTKISAHLKGIDTKLATLGGAVKEDLLLGEIIGSAGFYVVRLGVTDLDTPETAGKVYLADPTQLSLVKSGGNKDPFYAIGVIYVSGAKAVDDTVTVYKLGNMPPVSHGLTKIGEPFFLDSDGALVQPSPTTPGEAIVRLGIVKTSALLEISVAILGVN